MSTRGKEKKAQKRKEKKKAERKATANMPNLLNPIKAQEALNKLFDHTRLTTPATLTDDVIRFCKKISETDPFYIQVEPEPWSRQSCCDMNVHEYIRINGGKIICGYRIWSHPPMYIEGERHALWFRDGVYKDISFSPDGEERILFIPDITEKQSALELNSDRIRWGKDNKTRQLIELQEHGESLRKVHRMSNEQAWSTMLTYESWQNGQRMPNILIQPIS